MRIPFTGFELKRSAASVKTRAAPLPAIKRKRDAGIVLTLEQSDNFFSHVTKTESCWLWTGSKNEKGYGRCDADYGSGYAHRVSFLIHNGQIPDGLLVLHHCDVPGCVNPGHLFLGTDADNAHDRDAKGRRVSSFGDRNGSRTHPELLRRGDNHPARARPDYLARGDAHRRSKLSSEKVVIIRSRYASGLVSQKQLAKEFGVDRSVIGDCISRKTWRTVV